MILYVIKSFQLIIEADAKKLIKKNNRDYIMTIPPAGKSNPSSTPPPPPPLTCEGYPSLLLNATNGSESVVITSDWEVISHFPSHRNPFSIFPEIIATRPAEAASIYKTPNHLITLRDSNSIEISNILTPNLSGNLKTTIQNENQLYPELPKEPPKLLYPKPETIRSFLNTY